MQDINDLETAQAGEVNIRERVISPGGTIEGLTTREVGWLQLRLVASIRRGAQTVIPHGNTVLQTGDVLLVAGDETAQAAIESFCQRDSSAGGEKQI